ALARPDLAKQSALYRMRQDPNANLSVTPDSIAITAAYEAGGKIRATSAAATAPTTSADGAPAAPPAATAASGQNASGIHLSSDAIGVLGWSGGRRLYIVDTKWQMAAGVYDGDKTLRLTTGQVHLITQSTNAAGQATTHLIGPIAYSRQVNPKTGKRVLVG